MIKAAQVRDNWLERAAEYVSLRNMAVRDGAEDDSPRVEVLEERASHCVSRAKGKGKGI